MAALRTSPRRHALVHAEAGGYVCAAEAVRRAQTGRGRVAAGSACAMWLAR